LSLNRLKSGFFGLSAWLTYAKREPDMDAAGGWSAPRLVLGTRALVQHPRPRQQNRRRQELQNYEAEQESQGFVSEYLPFVLAGLMLVAAFAFAGHYIGRNAQAHNMSTDEVMPLVMPTTTLATKGSLLPEGDSFATINMNILRNQTVLMDGKGDLEITNVMEPVPAPAPKPKFTKLATKLARTVQIIPASIDLMHPEEPPTAVKRMVIVPAVPDVAQTFKIRPEEKQRVVAQRRVRLAEENCLARAVYFEARSESDMGQLAVAKVILNRVKSPNFPKSICGVVYQGSGTRNSCQFSFACDGLPDDVKQPGAWDHAKSIAGRAINNDPAVAMMGHATNYHADYVKPRWAKTMRRLAKIGHHIFYANG
jgi:spore germination cell wall hydrolase CwlJ-like protein